MKSRLHEFSFKLNDVNYKNLFKNYECPSIDSKINIIDEIKTVFGEQSVTMRR